MDIARLLQVVSDVFDELQSTKTQEDIDQVFDLTDDVREKVIKAFHIASDAADDVAKAAIIVMEAAARMSDAAFSGQARALLPETTMADITRREDLIDLVVTRYQNDTPVLK